jgi:hypothetical protein
MSTSFAKTGRFAPHGIASPASLDPRHVPERTSLGPSEARKSARAGAWDWLRSQDGGAALIARLAILVFEARERAAARELRRLNASLGPNPTEAFGRRIDDLPFRRLD